MNQKITKAFSFMLVISLILFSSASPYALINCSTEMDNCCCSESYINSGDLELRGSCCECFVDNYKNEFAEKPEALINNFNSDLNGSFIENNFSFVSQSHVNNFNSPDLFLIKENIFLLNSNLRI
jgi:hypothetical protein